MRWYYFPLLVGLISCGSLQKMAIRSSSPVFVQSSNDLMKEGSWDFFQKLMPGNLKFLELLWEQDHNNTKLLGVLVKAYSGYAFTVHETLAFGDSLAGLDESQARTDAITYYTRSFDYGVLYFKHKKIKAKDLLGDEGKLRKKLKENLSDDDLIATLYFAQSWGSLINLQKDNVALISQIPKVKVLFDFVCARNPKMDENICDMFFAQYEAARPKMLGGNPELAEKLYQEAMSKYPQNLLIRMSYIQYFILPAYDQEKYEKEAVVLKPELAKWEDLNRDELVNKSPYRKKKNLNLYNAITKKRLEFIEKYKTKYF